MCFINGQPLTDVERLIADASSRPRRGAPLRAIQKADTDPKVVMTQTKPRTPRVGTNGGTRWTRRLLRHRRPPYPRAGIELFMLKFQPFEAEMARFAEHVIPHLRADRKTRVTRLQATAQT